MKEEIVIKKWDFVQEKVNDFLLNMSHDFGHIGEVVISMSGLIFTVLFYNQKNGELKYIVGFEADTEIEKHELVDIILERVLDMFKEDIETYKEINKRIRKKIKHSKKAK